LRLAGDAERACGLRPAWASAMGEAGFQLGYNLRRGKVEVLVGPGGAVRYYSIIDGKASDGWRVAYWAGLVNLLGQVAGRP